ncbi:MAG: DUF4340 domain-containing protein [Clostridia bacterium]|nr:DUF4340 domain-containing protein [Clostridia bacterium]
MLIKQLIIIIISVVVAIVLAAALIIIPMFDKPVEKVVPELLPGESYSDSYSKIMIFPAIEQSDISEVNIHNEHGDFGFCQKSDGTFNIIGYEGTDYSYMAFTMLMSSVRLPMALDRVTQDVSNLDKYGLDPLTDPAYYTITNKNGDSYKMIIGDMLPTGGGYYAMLEGRDAVYALDTTTNYILMPKESFVAPWLVISTTDDDYYQIERFSLVKGGERFIDIEFMDEQERIKTASTSYYKMLFPGDYVPSTSNYDHIMKKFVGNTDDNGLPEFKGSKVLAFGSVKDAMEPEELEPYGLDEPAYELYFRYKGVDNYVLISEQNEDGSYNVYSVMFNIVAQVSGDVLDFVSWDILDFVDKPMFQKNINDIDTVEIIGADIHETFKITGTDDTLAVTPQSTHKTFDADQLVSFKKLYIKLLSLSLEDYTESDSTDEWIMTFKVTTRGGVETEYSFYAYSTRRCYFTVNGKGEFWVLRDRVEKILADTQLIMSGGTVTSEQS